MAEIVLESQYPGGYCLTKYTTHLESIHMEAYTDDDSDTQDFLVENNLEGDSDNPRSTKWKKKNISEEENSLRGVMDKYFYSDKLAD